MSANQRNTARNAKRNTRALKVAVLTSTASRHMYFASRIAREFDVLAVFAERKQYCPESAWKTPEEERILSEWFRGRDEAQESFFGCEAREFRRLYHEKLHHIPAGSVNSASVIERLGQLVPDVIAVFGSSLLRRPLLEAVDGRAINMHLGLSPYYRGSGTNFWPFYYGEPQYVGVTIHWIDEGIDSGEIIHQGRPAITAQCNAHTIGCRTIVVGTDLMVQTFHEFAGGAIQSFPQSEGVGRLCRRKDFAARHVAAVQKQLERGLIRECASNPVEVKIIP